MGKLLTEFFVTHHLDILDAFHAVEKFLDCPGPAILGGFPILDLRELVSTGVNVSLGCDGSATNDSSSLLDTMRMGYLMQAWHCKARGGCVTPYEILKLATVGGAKTLGRSDLGSLEVGKCADLFMIDTDVPELSGTLHDPKNLLARVKTSPSSLSSPNQVSSMYWKPARSRKERKERGRMGARGRQIGRASCRERV